VSKERLVGWGQMVELEREAGLVMVVVAVVVAAMVVEGVVKVAVAVLPIGEVGAGVASLVEEEERLGVGLAAEAAAEEHPMQEAQVRGSRIF